MADRKTHISDVAAPLSEAAFAKYAMALRRYLARRLYAPAEAADLAQEIFARFLRKKDRPEVIRQPLAFLFGIAANVIREQMESQRTRLIEFDSDLAEEICDNHETPGTNEVADQVGLRDDLAKALATLPPNHLMAVLLLKGEGLSLAEAARRTGFTEGTLNVYLCEARWKLKRMLKDYAGKEDSAS
jgi:RNA polymerase sigma-70 factor, ECF subfamily